MERQGDEPSPNQLGIEIYLHGLSDEATALLAQAKRELLEIEQPGVDPQTYLEVSVGWGSRLADHPELGAIPPNVLLTYLGQEPQGLAQELWLNGQEE